jgi:Protein of unknown function (DUF3307)
MLIQTILAVLFIHYVSDFILQTRWMAENKSKGTLPLLCHISSYTVGLIIGLIVYSHFCYELAPGHKVLTFVMINVLSHFCIDYLTSKMNAYFFAKKYMAFFWWSIGLDQYLHTGLLVLTVPWLLCG